MIQKVLTNTTNLFYDSNIPPHYHFYNEDTGMLGDIAVSDLDISNLPEPPTGTSTERVDVIVRVKNQTDLQ